MLITRVEHNYLLPAGARLAPPKSGVSTVLIIKSIARMVSVDGAQSIVPDSVMILPAGERLAEICSDAPILCDFFEYTDSEQLPDELGLPSGLPLSGLAPSSLIDLIRRMKQEAIRADALTARMLSLFGMEFFYTLKRLVDERPEQHKRHLLDAVRSDIVNMPYVRWDADELASRVGLSRRQFYYSYINAYQTTPHQEIIRARIDYAKLLLSSTEMRASEIAVICCYDNYEHFSRLFKSRVGMTPRLYARQFNKYTYNAFRSIESLSPMPAEAADEDTEQP